MPTPSEVHAQLTTWIEALSTSGQDYAQADALSGTRSTWKQSTVPLVPEYDPEPRAHLAFFVDDRAEESLDANDAIGLLERAPLVVRFLFRIRPNSRVADWRLASDALVALRERLLAHAAVGSLDLTLTLTLGRFAERTPIGDGTWLACSLRISAIYRTDLL